MKLTHLTTLLLSLTIAAGPLCADPTDRLLRKAARYFEPLPAQMPGAENDTPERIDLGKRLYFDPRLSVNDTQSCAHCHPLTDGRAGMDGLPVSPGARGELGDRNAPTVINAGWQKAQFWDARAKDLADQAGQPILNPIEMGMPDEATVVNKLKGIPDYVEAFARAFPQSETSLSYANLTEAIAAFERTLRSEARFDDFLRGDKTALNEQELSGLKLFMGKNCVRCHDGPLLGGTLVEKLGVYGDFHNTADAGRFRVTGDEDDRMAFKVAPLRNVAVTGPWFHDGSGRTLAEVVGIMARIQLDTTLSEQETTDIVAFLSALTGRDYVTKP